MVFHQNVSTDVSPVARQRYKFSSIQDEDMDVVCHDLFVHASQASSEQKTSCHSDCTEKVSQPQVQIEEQELAQLRLVFDAPSHRGRGLQRASSC